MGEGFNLRVIVVDAELDELYDRLLAEIRDLFDDELTAETWTIVAEEIFEGRFVCIVGGEQRNEVNAYEMAFVIFVEVLWIIAEMEFMQKFWSTFLQVAVIDLLRW